MIGLGDRQALARDIDAARTAGARLRPAFEVAGTPTVSRLTAIDYG